MPSTSEMVAAKRVEREQYKAAAALLRSEGMTDHADYLDELAADVEEDEES